MAKLLKFKPVIGLEIHVELKTNSKMFCQCPADYFAKPPNSQVCPVCLGLPGALPVPNKKAIDWTILLGKALNCHINNTSRFDRKHYFYPDLPKGYQISQYDQPIAVEGRFLIFDFKSHHKPISKSFRIRRVHLEEDTGKLIHQGGETLIDFNRSGVPLVEIVTEPDFTDSNEVKQFLEQLQTVIRYLGVSDCDMEKGTMRLEPNISVIDRQSSKNQKLPNYKVEIKNINSFRFVKQAIDYELKRQIDLLKSGKPPVQETRGFDEKRGITYSQRFKEEAYDYRYFPDPDIPPLVFPKKYIDSIQVPELPKEKISRYTHNWRIRFQDAFILTREKQTADYFETVVQKLKVKSKNLPLKTKSLPQTVANFIVNKRIPLDLTADQFAERMIQALKPKTINQQKLNQVINQLIKINKKAVADYKRGKKNALMFLVGQAMKEVKGAANPKLVLEKIKDKIEKPK